MTDAMTDAITDAMTDATFHALLIGADGYYPNVLSSQASYASLRGCVADVAGVEAMLRSRLAGARLEITTLLGPAGRHGEPTGDPATSPTAANLRRALAEVAERARPGDQVYIHYSGHGGRVTTASTALKGDDGVDEALVPIDIGVPDAPGAPPHTRPERYIRDVELALYLERLAARRDGDRRVTVTLVLDACHAGGATRGIGDLAKRSAIGGRPSRGDPLGTLDRRALDAGAPGADHRARMAAAYARLETSGSRAATPAQTRWLPPAEGYVLLAACRDVEAAIECSIDGRPRGGVLTGALLEAIAALGRDQTWKTVYDRVLAHVQGLVASQTPQLLGDLGRHVLGVELAPVEHTHTVTAIDEARRTVTISGGLALTITTGTQLGIYAPGTTDFSRPEGCLAIVTVRDAEALAARAVVDDDVDLAAISVGAPAVIRALPLRRTVELFARGDLPPAVAARQDGALASVASRIGHDGEGFLELAAAGTTPHYQVALSPEGRFELCDPRGEPFPYLAPAIAAGEPHAAGSVVAQLRRLGRYHTVLEMSDPGSALLEQLSAELLVAPAGWTDDLAPANVGGTPLARTGDAYTVASGTWMWLRLTNRMPGRPLNVALLDLGRTWEIEMIVPNPAELAGKPYETIGDTTRTFAFQMYTPVPESIDVLKLFITVGHVDFGALTTTGARRAAGVRRGPGHALARLIDAINARRTPTRDAAPARSASSPWTVRDFRMRTLPRLP